MGPSLGQPSGPAEPPGFGLLDRDDTMDLLAAAAGNPATRWCLTVTDPRDDTAAAHGCAPGRRTLDTLTSTATAAGLAARLGASLTPITRGACDHAPTIRSSKLRDGKSSKQDQVSWPEPAPAGSPGPPHPAAS